jgi:hypothetical protein
MLNIQIDNPEIEKSVRLAYGENSQAIAMAFADFIRQKTIKQDIGISIQQINSGQATPMSQVINEIVTKYE